jgi:thiamine-phosphate pyrophosphorylase
MGLSNLGAERRVRLSEAHLYLVCDSEPGGRELSDVLSGAIAGGVEVVQLRDKKLDRERLVQAASTARAVCAERSALFIVNDLPDVAVEVGADGVHVGQDDMDVQDVREIVGAEMLVGLSTHSPLQVDAAVAVSEAGDPYVDYIGVGPVYETPTKLGRPAVGPELVSYASAQARVPFFAIGGIDADNVADVLDAGATRICVLRAIAEADDPERASRTLRAALTPRLRDSDGRA